MSGKVEVLEAQVNALAQAWLRLAAAVEVAGLVEHQRLVDGLRAVRWPNAPLEHESIRTMAWLCGQLDDAHQSRSHRV